MNIGDWTEKFQGTKSLTRDVRDRLIQSARVIHLQKNEVIFGSDIIPDSLFFLYEGTVRVSQTSECGRDIVLYRVIAGESCVLTTACVLAEEAYNAEGIAETDLIAITLPKSVFERLASEEEDFRKFIFAAYSRRLIDLLRVVNDVAFGRIDVRLAHSILSLAGTHKEISTTHQQLASELGTAREVVSRVLHDFQNRGMISQSRGRITLSDRSKLTTLAASHEE